MTKQEFVDRVSSKGNMSRREAADAVESVLAAIAGNAYEEGCMKTVPQMRRVIVVQPHVRGWTAVL